jgi:membrane protein
MKMHRWISFAGPGATLGSIELSRLGASLWPLVVRLFSESTLRTASAMAFDLFLALIPMLALAGWLFARLSQAADLSLESGAVLMDATPSEMHELLSRHFQRIGRAELAPFAALGGWWLTSSAFGTLISVYERSFAVKPRPWYHRRLIAMGCALLAIVAMSLNSAIGLLIAMDKTGLTSALFGTLEMSRSREWLGVAVAFVVAVLFFAFLFKVSIRRRAVIKRHVMPGAVVTVLLGAGATALFGVYLGHLARFTLFYGSLATVAITMAWLWLWCLATLTGIEVNVVLENLEVDSSVPDAPGVDSRPSDPTSLDSERSSRG